MTQFIDENNKLAPYLHSITDTKGKSGAEGLHEILKEQITSKPFARNMLSLSTDNASVMKGSNNGLGQKIKADFPWLSHNFCISHSCNLISQYASKTIPYGAEKLISRIHNHFAHSSKRIELWLELQEELNLEPYKILNYAVTRWLSLENCVIRILMRWDALVAYFQDAKGDDVKSILKLLKNPEVKVYLQFLRVALKKINSLNQLFQSRSIIVTRADKEFKFFFNHFMNLLLKEDYRDMKIDEKMKLIKRAKSLDAVLIDPAYTRSPKEFKENFISIFKNHQIQFELLTSNDNSPK